MPGSQASNHHGGHDDELQDRESQTPKMRRAVWAGLQSKAEQYIRYRDPHLREKLAGEIYEAMFRDGIGIAYRRLPDHLRGAERAKAVSEDAVLSFFAGKGMTLALAAKQSCPDGKATKFESDGHMRGYFLKVIQNKLEDFDRREKWGDQPRSAKHENEDEIPTIEPGQPSAHITDALRDLAGGGQGDEFDIEKVLQINALRRLMQTELNPDTELPVLLLDLYGPAATDAQNAETLGIAPRLYKTRLAAARARLQKVYRDLPSPNDHDNDPSQETFA